jgi:tetratricopeptide (TPR) repeat protein
VACCIGDQLLQAYPEEALAYFEKASDLNPGRDIYWLKLGHSAELCAGRTPTVAERRRLLEKARAAFDQAKSLVPVDPYNRRNLGQVLTILAREGLTEPGPVFDEFDYAIALDSNNVYFYLDAGNAALMLGDRVRAGRYSSRGSELFPRFGPIRAQMGYYQLAEKHWPDAVGPLHESLVLDWYGDEEGYQSAAATLTATLVKLQRFQEAVQVGRNVLERASERGNLRFLVGQALEGLGRKEEAITEYRRVITGHPNHKLAREALFRLDVHDAARSN